MAKLHDTSSVVIPPIMEHPIWAEIKKYFAPQRNATKTRAHFTLQSATPEPLVKRALAVRVPCCRCGEMMSPFRIHANSTSISMHVSCLRDDHKRCSYGHWSREMTPVLQNAIGQGTMTVRVKKIASNGKQKTFKVKEGKDGPEFVFG